VACGRDGGGQARNARTCSYKRATVASWSTICKAGTTFRCQDGEWYDLGTNCR
jgi:hypothetical protein